MKRYLFHGVFFALAFAVNVRAQCQLTRIHCKVKDVASFDQERVHVRCDRPGIEYFAVPASTPDVASRLVQVGTLAMMSSNLALEIDYCESDRSGQNVRCDPANCRLTRSFFLIKLTAAAAADSPAEDEEP